MPYNTIDVKRAKTLVATKNAKLIDIRSPVEFNSGSIPGAMNIPFRNVSSLPQQFKKDQHLIFFGVEGDDTDATKFQSYAVQMGFEKTYVLRSPKSWNGD